ncbi:MAG: plasmid maintenance system antidote protein [Bacteroidota bacterium]
MEDQLSILKGLHPGIILDRLLKERNLSKGAFALSIREYPQTLGAITKGKRAMNTPLALRIENALGLEEGFLMTLQVFHEIKEEKLRLQETSRPDLTKIRPGLFWDTDINKINWHAHTRAVIERILERGNEEEKAEINRFYGETVVQQIANQIKE